MRSCSWVASQFLRRDSSGWEDVGRLEGVKGEGERPARRVSCTPGAEGAEVEVVVWVKVEGLEFSGTMRRDWEKRELVRWLVRCGSEVGSVPWLRFGLGRCCDASRSGWW
jgi:hypothetical protein